MKINICKKCGNNFSTLIEVDGKLKSLQYRKFCLICSPYRGNKCRKKVCKKCGNIFSARMQVNGIKVGLYDRSCCLVCDPYNSRKVQKELGQIKRKIIEEIKKLPRICSLCGEKYIYDKSKGHGRWTCNSCLFKKRYIVKKERMIKYKGGKCIICGYNKCSGSLDFHHRNPLEKSFSIGTNWSKGWNKLAKELDKCDLLCKNCHMETHEQLDQKEWENNKLLKVKKL